MKKIINAFSLLSISLFMSVVACSTRSNNDSTTTPSDDSSILSQSGSSSERQPKVITGQIFNLASPSGNVEVQVTFTDIGEVYYQVFKNNIEIVEYSKLGYEFDETSLNSLLSLEDEQTNHINFNYDNITGRHSHVDVTGEELVLTLSDNTYDMDIIFRAYDDGFAFKYEIDTNSTSKTLHIQDEVSEFAIPDKSVAWTMNYQSIPNSNENPNCFAYEENYSQRSIKSLMSSYVSMPMLYRVGETQVYCEITESDLIGSGTYGSFLTGVKDDVNQSTLHTVHSPASNNIEKDSEREISLPFSSPWRVGMVGTLSDITNSELVEKVYGDITPWRPDNYDELSESDKAIYDYDWVDDGSAAWSWLRYTGDRGQEDFDLHEEYLDHAIAMGWKYVILDGGWVGASECANKVKALTERAHKNGVKIIAWVDSLNNFSKGTSSAALRVQLKTWKGWGIDGIKIDFFDGQTVGGGTRHQGEDKDTIKWYESIYQECAKLQMVVNCHGCNKPTGERRLYPNVINREAIRGNENTSVSSQTVVNSIFIRSNVGPTDFTPTVDTKGKHMSKAELMGVSVLYESGSISMAGKVNEYTSSVRDFWKELPNLWDDSYFIDGELDKYIVMARKKGDDWYIGCVSCLEARDINVNFNFLDNGNYSATIYKDGSDYTDVTISSQNINKNTSLTIPVIKNGGFAIVLKK